MMPFKTKVRQHKVDSSFFFLFFSGYSISLPQKNVGRREHLPARRPECGPVMDRPASRLMTGGTDSLRPWRRWSWGRERLQEVLWCCSTSQLNSYCASFFKLIFYGSSFRRSWVPLFLSEDSFAVLTTCTRIFNTHSLSNSKMWIFSFIRTTTFFHSVKDMSNIRTWRRTESTEK